MDINKEIAYKASDADRMIYRVLPAEKGYQKTVFQASCSQMGIGTGISRDYEFYSDQQFV